MNGKWEIFGTSVIGPLHLKNNVVNQDSYFHKKHNNMNIVVVCDGLGSKKFSHVGSQMAGRAVYNTACETDFSRFDWQLFIESIYQKWYSLIDHLPMKECATTCLFVIAWENKLFSAQIGDGAIVFCNEDVNKSFMLSTKNDKNNFSNQTYSMANKFSMDNWCFHETTSLDTTHIILCTDGISDDINKNDMIPYAHYIMEKKRKKRQIKKLMKKDLENWGVPNHTDDKTLACLFKK